MGRRRPLALRRDLFVAIEDDLLHGTPIRQGELLAMPPITIEIKEFILQRLLNTDAEQLLAIWRGCPYLGSLLQNLIVELCIGILYVPSGVLIAVFPYYLALCEHDGIVTQTATELQGIVVVEELPAETNFAVHKDVFHLVQVQAVVLLTFHFPVVVVMVHATGLLGTAFDDHRDFLYTTKTV